MSIRLSEDTTWQLPEAVARHGYDRTAVTAGIVHLGVGAFHRAHQAAYIDECLAAGETQWGIIAASLRSTDTRDALLPQDGLYTLAVRASQKEALQIVGAIIDVRVAPENPAALVAAMADPAIRIVTLTVTEKAYLRKADGSLDISHPDIQADLANPLKPRSIYGFILAALVMRRDAGHPPFTVISCDNLPANGKTLHRLLTEFAAQRSAELATYVADELSCPCSMVDRIVPATTDQDRSRIAGGIGMQDAWPVVSEPFHQWVIEDRFPQGRPNWERFGVTMVDDVAPFEIMKLRLLNGAHSAIAYLGQLLDLQTVADAFAAPDIRHFVDGLWSELIPTLPENARLAPQDYIHSLTSRFSNTALRHMTAQIANDGSQKLPQRIVEAALERLAVHAPVDHLSFVIAAWIAALQARRTDVAFSDPFDPQLTAIDLGVSGTKATVAAVFKITGFAAGAGGQGGLARLVDHHLTSILTNGPQQALAHLNTRGMTK